MAQTLYKHEVKDYEVNELGLLGDINWNYILVVTFYRKLIWVYIDFAPISELYSYKALKYHLVLIEFYLP